MVKGSFSFYSPPPKRKNVPCFSAHLAMSIASAAGFVHLPCLSLSAVESPQNSSCSAAPPPPAERSAVRSQDTRHSSAVTNAAVLKLQRKKGREKNGHTYTMLLLSATACTR